MVLMLTEKINKLREEINKLIASNNADEETLLALSKELDIYIVDYLKSKMETTPTC